eukprot:5594893-Prymnesium_polylepis.1
MLLGDDGSSTHVQMADGSHMHLHKHIHLPASGNPAEVEPFFNWLMGQVGIQSPIGRFAREVRLDTLFPLEGSFREIYKYFHAINLGSDCEVFCDAWGRSGRAVPQDVVDSFESRSSFSALLGLHESAFKHTITLKRLSPASSSHVLLVDETIRGEERQTRALRFPCPSLSECDALLRLAMDLEGLASSDAGSSIEQHQAMCHAMHNERARFLVSLRSFSIDDLACKELITKVDFFRSIGAQEMLSSAKYENYVELDRRFPYSELFLKECDFFVDESGRACYVTNNYGGSEKELLLILSLAAKPTIVEAFRGGGQPGNYIPIEGSRTSLHRDFIFIVRSEPQIWANSQGCDGPIWLVPTAGANNQVVPA